MPMLRARSGTEVRDLGGMNTFALKSGVSLSGDFEITVNGQQVYSKQAKGAFPVNADVSYATLFHPTC